MVLSTVAKGVREQNWLAVTIEFFIVAVGVFLGVQLGNWNEDRAEAERERVLIDKLKQDFAFIEETLLEQRERSENYLELVTELRAFLEDETPLSERDISSHIDAMISASRPARPSPTYVEMQASGALSRLDNQELRAALVAYHLDTEVANRGLDWALEAFDPSRITLRYLIPLDGDYEGFREAVGEVNYMIVAHGLQVRYANASLDLAREVLEEIEESRR
ncbi:hypothetical protein [Parvularcula lutaonensis]|uniref:Uncharacterized protein n=1 Tax=Parvularcula lutaonensis TaxID=491923 RepID=A0ABV7MA82_9PROT|nr:hypothetical protein [Parvularcula lutaonensis]GGY44383.1 hypothetical protein GCM10007148_11600 [Parvularcula lutaonensis]